MSFEYVFYKARIPQRLVIIKLPVFFKIILANLEKPKYDKYTENSITYIYIKIDKPLIL